MNAVGESETPPSNDAQVFEPPDRWDKRFVNAVGHLVPKKGPKCPFSGFAGHTEDKCCKKHPHHRKPLILKSGKPKLGTGPGNRMPKGKGLPKECPHCKKEGHKHSYLKAEWEAERVGKGTKSYGRQRPAKVSQPLLKVVFVFGLNGARLCTVQLTSGEPVWLREP